jgi:SAM-dependent methyltransferase
MDHEHGHGKAKGHGHGTWDERYCGAGRMWSGEPNEALVRETGHLAPGTALDVGCGEGADAIWLARRGWAVTALDVSAVALGRAEAAAADAGVVVAWQHRSLADVAADVAAGTAYDLVTVLYPALLRGDGSVMRTLLGAVAPGGTLLVVHHAHVDRERALAHGYDPDDDVRHQDLLALLRADPDAWEVEVAGEHARTPPEGPGVHHHVDLVLRARSSATMTG